MRRGKPEEWVPIKEYLPKASLPNELVKEINRQIRESNSFRYINDQAHVNVNKLDSYFLGKLEVAMAEARNETPPNLRIILNCLRQTFILLDLKNYHLRLLLAKLFSGESDGPDERAFLFSRLLLISSNSKALLKYFIEAIEILVMYQGRLGDPL